jgi:ABC-type sugar transport system substrate-binding protein
LAEISPILENARDKGIVIVTLRGRSIPAADYNIEPFSNEALGEKMINALADEMGSRGSYVTLLPSFDALDILDIENSAVSLQKQLYGGMIPVDRLAITGRASRAREIVRKDLDRYSIRGAMFFTSADGMGAAGQTDSEGRRLSVVGLGDAEMLQKDVEAGNIGCLFYWKRSNLVLAGLEFGRAAANGRHFDPKTPVSLALEGYETIRHAGGNTWAANDIRVLRPQAGQQTGQHDSKL